MVKVDKKEARGGWYGEYSKREDVPCALEEYFKANPKETYAMLSCSCPKCSVIC